MTVPANVRGVEVCDMDPLVLAVDMAGLPQAWVELEEAITYHAKQMVAWSIGREVREFRGGWQKNGVRSRIATTIDPRDQGQRRRRAPPRAGPHQPDAVRARPPGVRAIAAGGS